MSNMLEQEIFTMGRANCEVKAGESYRIWDRWNMNIDAEKITVIDDDDQIVAEIFPFEDDFYTLQCDPSDVHQMLCGL